MPHRRPSLLNVYLLGQVDFLHALTLQRRLVYEISGERDHAALMLCEHDPLITVGREGSRSQIHYDPAELDVKGWPVRWVNRGGGCLLHAPGQLAIYPILPLNRLSLDVPSYLAALRGLLIDVAADAGVHETVVDPAGAAAGGRLFAGLGVAVRDWVAYFGAVLNINPDLELFRRIDCGGAGGSMTSLERERRLALNPDLMRQRVVERFMERFDLPRVAVFHDHPDLPVRPKTPPPLPSDTTYIVVRTDSLDR